MGITPILIILGIVLVVAAILAGASTLEGKKQRIRQYLVEQGATDIFISRAVATGDGGTNTYDVAFTDAQGEERRTRCTIRRGLHAARRSIGRARFELSSFCAYEHPVVNSL